MFKDKKSKIWMIGILILLIGFGFAMSAKLYLERKAVEDRIAGRRLREKKGENKKKSKLKIEGKKGGNSNPLKYGPELFSEEGHYLFEHKKITYKNEKYIRNSSIKAYVMVGIDRRGRFGEDLEEEKVGNADSIFVLAHDTANKRVKLLQVHRDSMAPVTITDEDGEELRRELAQITVAYGYGDGEELSIEYLSDSLSELFGGMEFDGYYVGTLDNITLLNDYIGGVEVTVEEDGLEKFDSDFVKGKKIVLTGEKAEKYIRSRDINEAYTAFKRLDRQKQYLAAFNEKLRRLLGEDSQIMVKLFKKVEETTMTSLRKDEYVGVGRDLINGYGKEEQMLTIPGYVETANKYEEFYPDMDSLYDIIVETFYRKLQS